MQTLLTELDQGEAELQKTAETEIPAVNSALEKLKLEPVKAMTREEWEKKQSR
jgi:hypothetical protein